ncbi:hypothetical protein DDB_G0274739 [Dictyostelium discoideum AX4]|uniref:Putative ZDHHC-type palmitoyltransferase 2 n=1 Tax=Dictyostelium discoideum TaxID=44689 RepID=ZDHC2_DICDI|nr:hypothetical protein DDB_G0274739 [Dictyostelium discoideum AX4]Q86A83.2 RecName: Full=Putative ZDHHC-type palmitoyltransferase 2; AltName: Full=Zinc finger DHHC domain-containing protein 2 [Dictyostelium discoideum]EAL70262.1 hypothetical protein DDB_G0274739 [Dictyostelium discoideum AX4]|eukprot:XP_643941.1 hypothetical protein DDB_G0274739 [Dictyostelium discoideum AX4]
MNLYNNSNSSGSSNSSSSSNNKTNIDYNDINNNDILTPKGYHTSIYIDDNDLNNNQIINKNNNNNHNRNNNNNNNNNNNHNNPKKMVINLNPSGIFIPLMNDFDDDDDDEQESLIKNNKITIPTINSQIAIPILNNNDNNNNSNNKTEQTTTTTTIIKNTTIFNNKTISFGRIGFRSIVIFLILVPYIYILNFAIFPWTVNYETERKGKIHSFISMALVIQMLCNYYLCSTTDPGSFKDTISPSYYLLHPISSTDSNDHKKWCNKCNHQKPERAHHCRYCNRCVLRMDHHCQWLQNCIGLFNQKYFVLFLFYTSISIIYFFTLLIKRSIELVTKYTMEKTLPSFDLLHLFLLGILIIILIIAGISIMALLWTQIALISKGLTTIEHEDKKRKYQQPNYLNLYKKYDKGSIISNFSIVFGNLSFLWLLPTIPNNLKITSKKGDIFIV